jgi:hypothetical protein
MQPGRSRCLRQKQKSGWCKGHRGPWLRSRPIQITERIPHHPDPMAPSTSQSHLPAKCPRHKSFSPYARPVISAATFGSR